MEIDLNFKQVFIIAEAGVNHNGSLDLAKKLIDVASDAGADAVKFQTFKADHLATKNSQKAVYQKTTDIKESQFDMLKNLSLVLKLIKNSFLIVIKKIIFLSAFDTESIDLLNNFGVEIFKVPSGEITNLPYLRHLGKLNKEVILSTGMSNIDEVKIAFNILVNSGTKKTTLLFCMPILNIQLLWRMLI